MKKKNRIKKGIAAMLTGVLAFSMTAGIMPGNVLRVQAADTGSKPETVYYATKDELMDGTFAPDENGKAKKIAKLQFGNRKDGTRWLSQKWYILGADSGVQGDNTVLFAAEPMVIGSPFNSDGRDRNYKTESGTYQNGNPTTVSANHYGASELRASMQAMVQSSYSEEKTYFTREEKRLLQKTTVTTTDIKNQKDYTTSDELYALKGDVGETVLRAGSRDDKVLAMDPYWQDGNYYSFWLRSASDSGKKPAVNIARMQSQVGYCDQINASYTGTYAIRPAANLNLKEALFASTAETSNGTALDLSKYYYDAMTLRLDGKAKGMDIGTVEYNPAQGLIKAEKGTIGNQYDNPYGGMYWEDSYGDSYYHVSLVVQGGDDANPWCYSEYIEGLEYVDVDDIQKELTEKNITTEPVDLSKCKIWLETTGWYYKLTYAVEATETTEDLETKISKLNVWDIDAPVAGEALDTSCEIYTSGLTTRNPVVTWTPNHTTAEYDTAYTTSVTLEAKKHYIFTDSVFNNANISKKKAKVTKNPDGTLTLTYTFPKTASNTPAEPEHTHCLCGRETADEGGTSHTHQTETWTGISSLDEIKAAGKYYLKSDVELKDTWNMNIAGGVSLCLNGHSITGANGKSVIKNTQDLLITDCHSGSGVGTITHKSGETGRGIENNKGTFVLYNSCITGNTVSGKEEGGGIKNTGIVHLFGEATIKDNEAVAGGGVCNGGFDVQNEFYMHDDSSITGNTATERNGGGVYTYNGMFSMENNAAITGNTAQSLGGGVYYSGLGSFKMNGGSITGNKSFAGVPYGGGFFANGPKPVELSGKVIITDNTYGTNGKPGNYHQESDYIILASGLVEGSKIGIGINLQQIPTEGNPIILTDAGSNPAYFQADSEIYEIITSENAAALAKKKKVVAPMITTQPQEVTVKAGETATFTVVAAGTDLTYQWQIDRQDQKGFVDIEGATGASYTTGKTDETCSGFRYRCTISNSAGNVKTYAAKLTVEAVEQPPAEPEHRHCLCGQETAEANVSHNHSTATDWTGISSLDEIRTGGNYYLKNDINLTDAWEMNVDGFVFLCLNGHTITGADGKDVIVNKQSLLITDCHSGSEVGKITHKPGETGRGILNEESAFLAMYNGCITGNTAATDNGGGVWNKSKFMMLGGSITGNSATKNAEYNGYGGGVYNYGYGTDVTCKIEGNAVISNNSASNGGGICNFNILLIDGRATVKDNNAVNGGGVWNGGSPEDTRVTMSGDSSITGNTATYGGGGVYTCEGYFGMEGNARIARNSVSDGSGGGVFHSGNRFSMDGGSITENTGGGIFVNSRNEVRLRGKVTITGNKATTGSSTKDANYHQESNHVIEADELAEGSMIGIEVSYERYPGTKPTIMTNQGCKPEYFSSDSKNCAIVLYENAVALSEIKSPEISSQPQDATVKAGETATFTVEATGTDLTYQWQIDRNDGTGFADIEGATSASYTTGEADATCNGFAYRCVIRNSRDYVTTFEAKLTVEDITPPPAKTYEIIATAGANGSISPSGTVTVTEGENQTFTITAAEGYEIDSLKVDGAAVTVASSYTFEHVTAAHTIEVTFRAIPPEKDKIMSIKAPAGITVANNTAYADMNLPAQVNIVTEKNTVSQAAVTWDTSTPASGSYDPAVLTEQTVTLNGTVTCPEELDANGVALTTRITITISAAGIAGAPEVSVAEGSYTENQTVTLSSTTEGAKIYYTTDGSAPEVVNGTPAGTTKEYNGPISITGTQGQEVKTTVRAIAIKSGMQNSEEKTFTYTIAIPTPDPDPDPTPTPDPEPDPTPTPDPDPTPTPDPDPTPTPTPDPTPMPAPQYSIIEGANSTWTQSTDGSLVIRGDGDAAKFVNVKVDGEIVDRSNYTVTAGSTIVTFKPDYLKTLAVGSHTFEMIWTDGTAGTNFTVTQPAPDTSVNTESKPAQVTDNKNNVTEANEKEEAPAADGPLTGDSADVVLWATLLLASLAGLAGMLRRRKR